MIWTYDKYYKSWCTFGYALQVFIGDGNKRIVRNVSMNAICKQFLEKRIKGKLLELSEAYISHPIVC